MQHNVIESHFKESIMKCSICKHNDILPPGYGNNAQPINNDRCCDSCNNEFVIPKRLKDMEVSSHDK